MIMVYMFCGDDRSKEIYREREQRKRVLKEIDDDVVGCYKLCASQKQTKS